MDDFDTISMCNSNIPCYGSDDDEVDIKPRLEDLIPLIPERPPTSILAHSVHDFSIHLHKVKQCTSSKTSFTSEGAESQKKSKDYFVAQTCCTIKRWTPEEVSEAIVLEQSYFQNSTLLIKLPDKKISKQFIAKQSDYFRAINLFNPPHARRYCIVLKDPTKRDEVLKKLNSTRFEQGYFTADYNYDDLVPSITDIDPFTLFVDFSSFNITHNALRDTFTTSQQIMVCSKMKMNHLKRFAFVVFPTVTSAMLGFKDINKYSGVIARFRRFSGTATLPSEYEIKKNQGSGKKSQVGGPIIIDLSYPRIATTSPGENNRIVRRAIKVEPVTNDQVVLNNGNGPNNGCVNADNGGDDDNISVGGYSNYYSIADFGEQYINLKRSREVYCQQDQDQENSNQ